jgi:formylglycine-generating enzyme required for sulfatase activity
MGRSTSGTDAFGGDSDEQPEHVVEVATFGLDRYEVTVGRFRKFVAGYEAFRATLKDGMGAHPLIPGSGWQSAWTSELPTTASALTSALKCDSTYQTWTDSPGSNENKPQNCMTWYQAFAFCLWDGGRLPTEAEWEYAAAGGSENRLYPWGGQAPDKTLASHDCLFSGTWSCEAADLPVVGSTPLGKGRYGQMDLAGSLWEWNLDWYDASWYSQYSSPGSCKNCANVSPDASNRVVRGGRFISSAANLRAAYRGSSAPDIDNISVGARCARTPYLCRIETYIVSEPLVLDP